MKKAMSIILVLFFLVAAGETTGQTTIIELPVYKSAGQLWIDNDGNLTGFRLKVLDALNRELKKDKIEFKYLLTEQGEIPIKRCIKEILDGKYDAYFGLIYSKKREEMGLFFSNIEIYSIPAVVWMSRNNMFDYEGPNSFKNKKIGIVIGYPYLKSASIPGMIIEPAPDDETNVKLLVLGRIDAIVDNIVRTGTVITNLGFADKITCSKNPFNTSRFHIAYNKKVSEFVRTQTDAALIRLHKSHSIQKILDDNIYNPLTQ